MKIPPFELVPRPLTDEAARLPKFRWAGPEVGKRHRLGGEPVGMKPADFPKCNSCSQEMSFYGQLDSINDDIVIGDAGLVCVFVCFDCLTAAAVLQTA